MTLEPQPSSPPPDRLLLDAHAHFHECFAREPYLDAAVRNFRRGARELGLGSDFLGCLAVCDTAQRAHFKALWGRPRSAEGGRWSITTTDEDCSLIATRRDSERLLLVAGRQITTEEGLELLALGSADPIPDRLPLLKTIERTRASGAVSVLPWGFGKWWFRRGRLVRATLTSAEAGRLFVGDNAGRPRIGPRPRLLTWAARREIIALPGTDPLPFPTQASTAGSYGLALPWSPDERVPAARIKASLEELVDQPPVYGELESLGAFVRQQLLMQWKKRESRSVRS